MGHPIATTVTLAAASANNIGLSQTLAAAGPLALNGSAVTGGVAKLDAPRRIILTSGGNDTGITFTVTGTARVEQGSVAQTETITGANATAATTTQDFATVTRIVSSGATASTVTAGTSGTGSGPWVPWDRQMVDFQVSVAGFVLSGSPTWGVEYTYDDVFGTWLPAGVPFPRAIALSTVTAQSGTKDGQITWTVAASRLTLTAVGSVQLIQTQQGD